MRRGILIWLTILAVLVGCSSAPKPQMDPAGAEVSPSSPNPALAGSITPVPTSLDSVPNLVLIQEMTRRGFTSWGCDEWRERIARWSPPTEGSPVVRYVLQYYVTLDSIPDTTVTLPFPRFWESGTCSVWARVAGVDSLDRQGPWSEPSDIEILEVE